MSEGLVQQLRHQIPGDHQGWGRREYSGWRDEQLSWKTTCYVGDWSFLLDLEFEGPDALRLFRDTSVNSFEDFAIGRAKHVVQCTPRGKVIGDGILMRVGDQKFLTQGVWAKHAAWILSTQGYDASWRQGDRFQFQVSGPKALDVCRKVTNDELTDVKFMHFKSVRIAGVEVVALRQGMAGEVGFEFHGPAAQAEAVMAAIEQAGQEFGIRKLGRRTAMINHLEAAFPTGGWHYLRDAYHPDFHGSAEWSVKAFGSYERMPSLVGSLDSESIEDYLQTPYSLGWGNRVKFDHEFIGREALEKEAKDPPRQRVTLEWNEDDVTEIFASMFREEPYDPIDIPQPERWQVWADRVENEEGAAVGISSPPGFSYYFRRMLSLAFVDTHYVQPGTELTLIWGQPDALQKRVRVVVKPAPYKTDNRRQELSSSQSR